MKSLVHLRLVTRVGAIALALSTVACASKTDPLKKDIEALQSEVARLRSANLAMQDRLDAIEISGGGAGTSISDGPDDDPSDRPVLEVVRLTPEEATEPEPLIATPETDEPRPVIKGDGAVVESFADEAKAKEAEAVAEKKRKRELAMKRWRSKQ